MDRCTVSAVIEVGPVGRGCGVMDGLDRFRVFLRVGFSLYILIDSALVDLSLLLFLLLLLPLLPLF